MLVYGDHSEHVDPRQRLARISDRLQTVAALPAGIARHAQLVGALIEAGQLLQGAEDAGAPAVELSDFVHRLARCVVGSWDSGYYTEIGQLPVPLDIALPRSLELRVPEGFAFYSVYPEAYADAARKLVLAGPPRVIGIRSIGTTLGPIVAAALNAPPAITVRPFGDPFAREVELPPDILDEVSHYVIVDEGPGLSGSSFGSVADWLERRGVPLERIAFLPSHSGDLGPQASDAHRQRWGRAQRMAAEFNSSFLEREFGPLTPFVTGSAWERCKFFANVRGHRVLLKFAGLGSIGENKLELARALHGAGFTAEPLGLVHGFLAERWCDGAEALRPNENPLEEIGAYIGARARLFPAPEASGASIDELIRMCGRNLSLAFGEAAASVADGWSADDLQKRVKRVRTDNKLDRSEWIRLPGGRLLKTDALDHHQAHDLIGCQGVEWDITGAAQEFELDAQEVRRLIHAAGVAVDAKLMDFYRLAYAAFRLGQATLAGNASAAKRHATALQVLLPQGSRPPRIGGNPRLIEQRNEPAREQTGFCWVQEEEADRTQINLS